MVAPPEGVLGSLNNDGYSNEDMTQHTMRMVEISEVLKTPGAEINSERRFFYAQKLQKKAYPQEGCVHAMEWQGAGIHAKNLHTKLHAAATNVKEPHAAASRSPSVPPQGNLDCALMDGEDIFVDNEMVCGY